MLPGMQITGPAPVFNESQYAAQLAHQVEVQRVENARRRWLDERAAAHAHLIAVEELRFKGRVPRSVAIVAMGASHKAYTMACAMEGGRQRIADETWVINAMGNVVAHDRVFQLDDVLVGEKAADGHNCSAGIMEWLHRHPGPVYTPVAHPDYPGAVEYPLEWVLNKIQHPLPHLNTSVPYALAYAMAIGVKKVSFWGCDFTYSNSHAAESGHACLAFLLGLAQSRGLQIMIPSESTLLDMNVENGKRFYGFREPVFLHQTPPEPPSQAWPQGRAPQWLVRPYPPNAPPPGTVAGPGTQPVPATVQAAQGPVMLEADESRARDIPEAASTLVSASEAAIRADADAALLPEVDPRMTTA